MSAADERVAELLGRWMASVDMHARYLALDDAACPRTGLAKAPTAHPLGRRAGAQALDRAE